jgi:uncharacterized RDD family membrane protein YckC
MTQWYYADASGQRHGPFSDDELRGHIGHGRLSAGTLVWRDGLTDWQPLQAAAPDLAAAVVEATFPETPSTSTPAVDAGPETYAPYAPPMAQVANEYGFVAGDDVVMAGFWRRVAALFIDSMVVGFAYYFVLIVGVIAMGVGTSVLLGDPSGSDGMAAMVGVMALIYLMYPLISALYYAGFESSSKQATLGKMAVGIKVTDTGGSRLTLGRALLRWLSTLLNYVTLYIGYLMAAFTERKQGLHDMVVGTLVVDRWAYTAHPDRQERGLGTVTKVLLGVFGALYGIAILAVLAAILIPLATR